MLNEIGEFLKFPREDFEYCKLLQWWLGRRSQFPNLYRLVRDIFSTPDENIFSCLFEANLPQHRFRSRSRAHFFRR